MAEAAIAEIKAALVRVADSGTTHGADSDEYEQCIKELSALCTAFYRRVGAASARSVNAATLDPERLQSVVIRSLGSKRQGVLSAAAQVLQTTPIGPETFPEYVFFGVFQRLSEVMACHSHAVFTLQHAATALSRFFAVDDSQFATLTIACCNGLAKSLVRILAIGAEEDPRAGQDEALQTLQQKTAYCLWFMFANVGLTGSNAERFRGEFYRTMTSSGALTRLLKLCSVETDGGRVQRVALKTLHSFAKLSSQCGKAVIQTGGLEVASKVLARTRQVSLTRSRNDPVREEVHRQANQLAKDLSLLISGEVAGPNHSTALVRANPRGIEGPVGSMGGMNGSASAAAAAAAAASGASAGTALAGLRGARQQRRTSGGAQGDSGGFPLESPSASMAADSPVFACTPPNGSPMSSHPGTPSTAMSPGASRPLGAHPRVYSSTPASPVPQSPVSPTIPISPASLSPMSPVMPISSVPSSTATTPRAGAGMASSSSAYGSPQPRAISPLFRPTDRNPTASRPSPFRQNGSSSRCSSPTPGTPTSPLPSTRGSLSTLASPVGSPTPRRGAAAAAVAGGSCRPGPSSLGAGSSRAGEVSSRGGGVSGAFAGSSRRPSSAAPSPRAPAGGRPGSGTSSIPGSPKAGGPRVGTRGAYPASAAAAAAVRLAGAPSSRAGSPTARAGSCAAPHAAGSVGGSLGAREAAGEVMQNEQSEAAGAAAAAAAAVEAGSLPRGARARERSACSGPGLSAPSTPRSRTHAVDAAAAATAAAAAAAMAAAGGMPQSRAGSPTKPAAQPRPGSRPGPGSPAHGKPSPAPAAVSSSGSTAASGSAEAAQTQQQQQQRQQDSAASSLPGTTTSTATAAAGAAAAAAGPLAATAGAAPKAAAAAGAAAAAEPAPDFGSWPMKQLKWYLTSRNCSLLGASEKGDLVRLCRIAHSRKLPVVHSEDEPVATGPLSSGGGSIPSSSSGGGSSSSSAGVKPGTPRARDLGIQTGNTRGLADNIERAAAAAATATTPRASKPAFDSTYSFVRPPKDAAASAAASTTSGDASIKSGLNSEPLSRSGSGVDSPTTRAFGKAMSPGARARAAAAAVPTTVERPKPPSTSYSFVRPGSAPSSAASSRSSSRASSKQGSPTASGAAAAVGLRNGVAGGAASSPGAARSGPHTAYSYKKPAKEAPPAAAPAERTMVKSRPAGPQNIGTAQAAAGAEAAPLDPSKQYKPQDLDNVPVSELKRLLRCRGHDPGVCLEKTDLVALACAPPSATPSAMQGTPGPQTHSPQSSASQPRAPPPVSAGSATRTRDGGSPSSAVHSARSTPGSVLVEPGVLHDQALEEEEWRRIAETVVDILAFHAKHNTAKSSSLSAVFGIPQSALSSGSQETLDNLKMFLATKVAASPLLATFFLGRVLPDASDMERVQLADSGLLKATARQLFASDMDVVQPAVAALACFAESRQVAVEMWALGITHRVLAVLLNLDATHAVKTVHSKQHRALVDCLRLLGNQLTPLQMRGGTGPAPGSDPTAAAIADWFAGTQGVGRVAHMLRLTLEHPAHMKWLNLQYLNLSKSDRIAKYPGFQCLRLLRHMIMASPPTARIIVSHGQVLDTVVRYMDLTKQPQDVAHQAELLMGLLNSYKDGAAMAPDP